MKYTGLLACALVVGCGDNFRAQPDASTIDAPPDAWAEAAHADPPQVVSLGGAVLAAPKVVPVFFSGDDAAQATIEQFLRALPPSTWWPTTTHEYGVGALTIAPSIVSSDAPPTTDAALQTWLQTNADGTHAGWPAPDANTIYTVFLPAGVTLTAGGKSCVSFGGYHSEAMGANSLVYALIPRCNSNRFPGPLDDTTIATSHEIVEASTDPHVYTAPAFVRLDPNHYVMNRTPGGELGDMCEYVDTAYQPLVGAFYVQRTWSNASALAGHDPCVPVLATPYVGAAPRLGPISLTTRNGTISTEGVMVNNGSSANVEVDVFSDAPGAQPVTVEAYDAATLNGGQVQLAFQWNRTTASAGDKLQLLITRTIAGTSRGNEFLIYTKQGGQIVSMWWGLVTGT